MWVVIQQIRAVYDIKACGTRKPKTHDYFAGTYPEGAVQRKKLL